MGKPNRLGPYRVEQPLGKGGMGHVYAAIHEQTGQRHAVKVLSPELALAEGFRDRFEAEIESLRTLRHPGVVRLYGYGEEDGLLFYSMELVEGPSLEEELQAGRRFTWREVTAIAIQVCRALKHAHDHGVIHRDIKPANILLDQDQNAKLADFGIAQLFGGIRLTSARGVLGTADFMSPEQAEGAPVTPRCDQYSLGCVMYAMLAGRPPFRARSLPEMLQLQRYAQAEPVQRFAPEAPRQLEQLLSQLLEKAPEDRFPNALVLARHLEAMNLALSKTVEDDFQLTVEEPNDSSSLTALDPSLQATRDNAALTESDHGVGEFESDTASRNRDSAKLATQAYESVAEEENQEEESAARTHFTAVPQDLPSDQNGKRWLILALQLLATLGLIGAASYGLFQAFRPPTADRLFESIQEGGKAGGSALIATEGEIQQFLTRFPNDSRIDRVQRWEEKSALLRMERRLVAKLRRRADLNAKTPPLESLYLEAMRHAQEDPETAIMKFRALAALTENAGPDAQSDRLGDGVPSTPGDFSKLARIRIRSLEQTISQRAASQRPFIEARLARAEGMIDTSPQAAREICEALIAFYSDRPWAEDLVEKARRLCERLPPLPPR